MRRFTSLKALVLGFSCVLLFASFAQAQFRAGVQGTVTDTGGGTVAGATVTLTNTETGQTQTTTASADGFYRFDQLPPGVYTLTVEQQGFKKRVVNNLKVEAEAVKGQDVVLEAGTISETVTVQAEELPLQTEDANIRGTMTTDQVLRLPQQGRDPYELARLAPGVFGAGARSSNGNSSSLPNTSGPGGSNQGIFQTENQQPISANGQRVSSNNYQIDGVSVNSQTWGGAAVITPSQESVKEVQVTSSTYSAEDGRNSGAQIKVVTQNGTNNWHGSAFYTLDEPGFNAYNKFHGVPGIVVATPTRVERKFHNLGGSFGGHIIKDKLFFFFTYEGSREKTANTYNSVIETAAFRQAMSAARPNSLTSQILSSAGIEPRVVQNLGGTCATAGIFIPCQVVNGGFDIGSPTLAYGQYVPLGAHNGGGFDGIADLQYAQLLSMTRATGNQYNTRIDWNQSKKNTFTFTSYFVPFKAFTSDNSAQSRPQADVYSDRLNWDIGVIFNRAISTRTLNEARFNITRWGYDETKSNPQANLGLPRIEIQDVFGDRLRFGFPRGANTPGVISERQMDFRDILTRTSGNMVFKYGAEYRRDLNSNGEVGNARPLFVMDGAWNFVNGTPIFEQINATTNGTPSPSNTSFHTSELAFFIQDDWKYRPNLTLNLGLRWDYFSPITADKGVLGNLLLDPNGGLAGAKITTAKQLYKKDLNNFGPQVGFAWSPMRLHDKGVVRGGFGMGYDRLPNALLANARRNPPSGGQSFGPCCGTAITDFGTPFAGGQILYVASTDGTIYGYPRNPNLGGGTNPANGLPNNGSVEIYGSPQYMPTPYVYRWSLEGQYQLPMNMVGTLGYQGSAGHHFVRIVPLSITAPTVNPNAGPVYFASPDVNTNYNAMLARLQGRLVRQVAFDINYRFSKSIDTNSYEAPTGLTNQSFPVDQHQERGPSDFDVRHYITASVLWDIPFFNHEANTWKGRLLGGWHIDAVATHHSGFPWTPRAGGCLQGTTPTNFTFCSPRPLSYTGQAPLANTNANFLSPGGIFPGAFIPNKDCGSGTGCNNYFGTVVPFGSPFQHLPGIGRNVFRGPRYNDLDMSFAKRFGLPSFGVFGESAALDIKFNFFNILNTLNLAPFSADSRPTHVYDSGFGTATDALAGRTGEFQIRFSF
jgi:hypothetical protein